MSYGICDSHEAAIKAAAKQVAIAIFANDEYEHGVVCGGAEPPREILSVEAQVNTKSEPSGTFVSSVNVDISYAMQDGDNCTALEKNPKTVSYRIERL